MHVNLHMNLKTITLHGLQVLLVYMTVSATEVKTAVHLKQCCPIT